MKEGTKVYIRPVLLQMIYLGNHMACLETPEGELIQVPSRYIVEAEEVNSFVLDEKLLSRPVHTPMFPIRSGDIVTLRYPVNLEEMEEWTVVSALCPHEILAKASDGNYITFYPQSIVLKSSWNKKDE